MLLGKKRKLGRCIEEIKAGEKLTLTEKIEDKDLLLYLGLTNDANPLFIQHDYASQTKFKKPIVPTIMLTGILTAAVSKYLPGPGSHILKQELIFHKPIFHYGTVKFLLEVADVDYAKKTVTISVQGENEADELAVEGSFTVCPPEYRDGTDGNALENF
ncbi:MaoC/PaaZ C-terminal domain-containing protein [Peribacillus sp. SCS-26]|uniref:MaoC/PaaZ C-terminal domain-containing protein n=1 Tax=Paraperibacillus marinus TaxID=3115295 RepID=UPI00390648F2